MMNWIDTRAKVEAKSRLDGRGSVNDRRAENGLPPLPETEVEKTEEATAVVVTEKHVIFDEDPVPLPKKNRPRRFRDYYTANSKEELAAINDKLKQLNVGVPPELIRWIDQEVLDRKNAGEEFTSRRAIVREALAMFYEQKALCKSLG